jgi:hypothetical protein
MVASSCRLRRATYDSSHGRATKRASKGANGIDVLQDAVLIVRSPDVPRERLSSREAATPMPCAGDIALDRPDTQVADGSLQQPNAAAARLAVGRVARLGASESQGVGHGVEVVTRRACERERVVAKAEVAAGTSQFETALPHALGDLQSLAAGRTRRHG